MGLLIPVVLGTGTGRQVVNVTVALRRSLHARASNVNASDVTHRRHRLA
jgi:hypothetical protein